MACMLLILQNLNGGGGGEPLNLIENTEWALSPLSYLAALRPARLSFELA
jgi:hypothetical protein